VLGVSNARARNERLLDVDQWHKRVGSPAWLNGVIPLRVTPEQGAGASTNHPALDQALDQADDQSAIDPVL